MKGHNLDQWPQEDKAELRRIEETERDPNRIAVRVFFLWAKNDHEMEPIYRGAIEHRGPAGMAPKVLTEHFFLN
jgi:hypothetical protein